MSIRETIKQNFIFKNHLRSYLKNDSLKAFVPLKKASSVGFLADWRIPSNKAPSIELYKKIKREGCTYKILLFISEKRIDVNLYDYERLFPGAQVWIVCPEDHSFWDVPKRKITFQFSDENFDILFRLAIFPVFDLDIQLLNCRSKMMAGLHHPNLSFLDFRIDVPMSSELKILTDNLFVYLEKLDQKGNKKLAEDQQNMLF